MPISRQDVLDTAFLARLSLDDAEVDELTQQLGAILGHMDKLGRLDTASVEPMTHAVPMSCPTRPDEVRPPLPRDAALAGAPHREGEFFAVPKIIDRDP